MLFMSWSKQERADYVYTLTACPTLTRGVAVQTQSYHEAILESRWS